LLASDIQKVFNALCLAATGFTKLTTAKSAFYSHVNEICGDVHLSGSNRIWMPRSGIGKIQTLGSVVKKAVINLDD